MEKKIISEADILQDVIEKVLESQSLAELSRDFDAVGGINSCSSQEELQDALYFYTDAVVRIDGDVYPYEPLGGHNLYEVSFDQIVYPYEEIPTCTVILQWRPDQAAFQLVCCKCRDSFRHRDVFLTDLVYAALKEHFGECATLDSVDRVQSCLLAVAEASKLARDLD